MMSVWPEKYWYKKHWIRWFLWPFSLIYQLFMQARRYFLQTFLQKKAKTPLIIVGNITVGGVGKTPLVIALVNKLKEKGLAVGVVSRGYGASLNKNPHEVRLSDKAEAVGDEPLLIKQKTDCPVVIAVKRCEAVAWLEAKHQVNIIISDDGLQHYAMDRTIEIAVMDGMRGLGNGMCLPAGPLREPPMRLNQVDFLIVNKPSESSELSENWMNAWFMHLKPGDIRQIQSRAIAMDFPGKYSVSAVAGIGNPQRFFQVLQEKGLLFQPYSYPDHYVFKPEDFQNTESIFLMTEKDAVKCQPFATDNMYYLPVEAVLSAQFWENFFSHPRLQGIFP